MITPQVLKDAAHAEELADLARLEELIDTELKANFRLDDPDATLRVLLGEHVCGRVLERLKRQYSRAWDVEEAESQMGTALEFTPKGVRVYAAPPAREPAAVGWGEENKL